MLDNTTITTIKSTLPLLLATGPKLTEHFYKRMFTHNPELKNIFNMSNQRNSDQPKALFHALCAYAQHIEQLNTLVPAVERIAQKHASFTIQAEQYPIVGHHLLKTLEELFNPSAEVLAAWGKAYQFLADIFIQRERALYQATEKSEGGWRTLRPFFVAEKKIQDETICSFTLVPEDNQAIIDFKPGQYLALYFKGDHFDDTQKYQQIRQYSLTHTPNGKSYRIAVKRAAQGKVSTLLHDKIQLRDIVHVAAPRGDFFLDVTHNTPVALISAGSGQTPMLSMLHTLAAQQHKADIYWLYATENCKMHAFADEVAEVKQKMAQLQLGIWYRQPNPSDQLGTHYHHTGLMDLAPFKNALASLAAEMHCYLCGPVAFMQSIAQQLLTIGIKQEAIHYECFGPHQIF